MNDNEDGNDYQNPITTKKNNTLPLWGNDRTMNLNPLILTNIQSSHYFKVNLYELKTYHEVIDEIYYKVQHLEPWEKGSRKTSGQTGMCGGVRGVGAGGIVSTAYCLLYKLFTLKMTRKQLNGLINHTDSPYIRAIGFMYIRYTQPPADLWDWYDAYLEDEEEVDVKAGGGQTMTIGNILRSFLVKLEWFSTLFPRIPVPIQQKIEKQMNERFPVQYSASNNYRLKPTQNNDAKHIPDNEAHFGEAERHSKYSKDSGYSHDKDKYKSSTSDKYSNNRYSSPDRKKYRYDSPDGKKSKYDSPDRKKSKYEYESSSSRDKYDSRDRYDRDRYSSSDKDRYSRDKYSSRDSKYERHERDSKSSRYHDDRTYKRY